MPIPVPRKGQDKNSFLNSCMSNDVMKKEFKDNKVRIAVCFSQWGKKHPEDKKPKESKSSAEDYTLLQDEVGLEIIDLKNKKVSSMSTGQLRKCIVARALIHDPKAFVLDEPTVGLDIKAQINFIKLLQKISLKSTIILVTFVKASK